MVGAWGTLWSGVHGYHGLVTIDNDAVDPDLEIGAWWRDKGTFKELRDRYDISYYHQRGKRLVKPAPSCAVVGVMLECGVLE